MLLASLGTSIANVALPTLAQAFGASFQEVQWIVLAYLSPSPPWSSARTTRRPHRAPAAALAGIFLFTAASVLVRRRTHAPAADCRPGGAGRRRGHRMALTMAFVGETIPKQRLAAPWDCSEPCRRSHRAWSSLAACWIAGPS